jgi:hypothetical protein
MIKIIGERIKDLFYLLELFFKKSNIMEGYDVLFLKETEL